VQKNGLVRSDAKLSRVNRTKIRHNREREAVEGKEKQSEDESDRQYGELKEAFLLAALAGSMSAGGTQCVSWDTLCMQEEHKCVSTKGHTCVSRRNTSQKDPNEREHSLG
jgi:hypothetical protein